MNQTTQACEVEVFVSREEDSWQFYCPALTLICYGETEEEAAKYCEEALDSFFSDLYAKGRVDDQLRFYNWEVKYEPVKIFIPPVKCKYAVEEMMAGEVIRSFKATINIPY